MTQDTPSNGRRLALDALNGKTTEQVPVTVMTWGFDYLWKILGVQPWELALGTAETWHRAHMAHYERHRPDIVWYTGSGGEKPPVLTSEDDENWYLRDENWGSEFRMHKEGLCLQNLGSGYKTCDPGDEILTKKDADEKVKPFGGWGDAYLNGLTRLLNELGDRALVLPNYCTSYISTCYRLGFERSMEMMIIDPDLFIHICEIYRTGEEICARQIAEAGGEVLLIADAWASCDIISRPMFERFALPYHRSFANACQKAGIKSILWNEGDIVPILDLEAALNYDAITFEQPRKGFDISVSQVRQAVGPDRCVMTNLDSEEMLQRNSPDEITQAVYQQIRESGQGSPVIISTGSPLPSNTPPEAVDTLISAARSFW